MGSTGSSLINPSLGARGKKLLSKIANDGLVTARSSAIRGMINPNYFSSDRYQENCALCTVALEMQMRGYNVEAGARRRTYRDLLDAFNVDLNDYNNIIASGAKNPENFNYDNAWRGNFRSMKANPNKFGRGAKVATQQLVSAMQRWGTGATAELGVKWRGKSSYHSMFVVNTGKEVVVIDGQDGRTYRGTIGIQSLLARTDATHSTLIRLDHLGIRDGAPLDKMIRRKS